MVRVAALLLLCPLCLRPSGDGGALAAPAPPLCADQAPLGPGTPRACLQAPGSKSVGPSLLQLSAATRARHSVGTEEEEEGPRRAHITRRRRLGARILSATEGGADASTLATFDGEVRGYARQYRGAVSGSLLTFFLHVSKTAGTLLCAAGKRSRCRVPDGMGLDLAINCNMHNDRLVWREPMHPVEPPHPEQRPATCEGLSALYASHNLTLASTESYLFAEGLCPEFFNVMLLRDPISRLISQLSMDLADSRLRHTGRESWEVAPARPAVIFGHAPAISNNFFIRSLLGRDVYTLPFGAVDSAHLDMAKRVLEEFDVLLVGESHRPASLTADIGVRLGLQVGGGTPANHGQTEDYRQSLNWTHEDWDALRAANALDMELWQHARHLDRLDAAVFAHPAFLAVSATMPHGPCGYLSK